MTLVGEIARSMKLVEEITPCKGCAVASICKYENAMQIQYNREIFEVSVACKIKESIFRGNKEEGLDG